MKNGVFLNPQQFGEQETFNLKLYKRVRGNTAYEYSKEPILVFKGRPANKMEQKLFRVTKGVNNANIGVSILSSNLPDEVEPDDKVEYMGKVMLVKNIGFYLDERFINAGDFSTEYLASRCPKGITLG